MDTAETSGDCFVLVSQARSGSTLLATTLGQHPEVVMFGELFNDEDDARCHAYLQGVNQHRNMGRSDLNYVGGEYHWSQDGAGYLDRLYRAHGGGGHVVGFKIHYGQASALAARTVWQYLADHPQLQVIQLERANLLEAYVSLKTAMQSGQWVTMADDPPARDTPRFALDPADCLRYFRGIERYGRRTRAMFRHHRVLELVYEHDLCRDFEASWRRVQEFLQVPYRPVTPVTRKQTNFPISERVTNLAALADYFAATPYAQYFTSPPAGSVDARQEETR